MSELPSTPERLPISGPLPSLSIFGSPFLVASSCEATAKQPERLPTISRTLPGLTGSLGGLLGSSRTSAVAKGLPQPERLPPISGTLHSLRSGTLIVVPVVSSARGSGMADFGV